MDYQKLYEIFMEEARELIQELEQGLLELERAPEDADLIDRIFRAAHTIKGSSGSLGLTDISAYMHSMEELLDTIRKGEMRADTATVNLLLESTDMVKSMLEAVARGNEVDVERFNELCRKMQDTRAQGATAGTSGQSVYRILFRPACTSMQRGIDPAMFLRDLADRGEILEIRSLLDSIPTLDRIDTEHTYIGWELKIRTQASLYELKSIFEFIEEESEIVIERMGSSAEVSTQDSGSRTRGRESATTTGATSAGATIRVDLKKLDGLLNAVGEMAIIQSMLEQRLNNSDNASGLNDMRDVLMHLQSVGRDVQELAMSLRMLPVSMVFRRFERLVRELAKDEGKEVRLQFSGEETELDKGIMEKLTDPLVHLVRNAIDHGIETPEQRVAAGKPPEGTLLLRAYQTGDSVYIEVSDDGKGLDRQRILEKAVERGLINEQAVLTEAEVFELIFAPGFSTAERITDVSGRGVGMDVVKRGIEALKGKVSIHSTAGRGSVVTVKLPLTLAIINGITARVGEEVYVLPVSYIVESFRPTRDEVSTLREQGEVIHLRGDFIPLVRLHRLLGVEPQRHDPSEAIVILVDTEGERFCILVDDILGEQQVVMKTLGGATPRVRDISGGTILGDGRVALVLDIPGIYETSIRKATIRKAS